LVVDTRRLFLKLLRTFDIETVCDVGSLDGTDALRFRRMRPAADIVAFEPNPRNFALMDADPRLRDERIRILPVAASDRAAEAPFFVVDAEHATQRDWARRGMSSLHRRSDSSLLAEIVRVRTARLDDVLAARAGTRIALWIDTEGAAFEAISGASGVLGATRMLHVEVETEPCIGANQRLFRDVEALLVDAGFALLATDQPCAATQFNALFVRADLLRGAAAWRVAGARLHRAIKTAVRPLVPRSLRRCLVRLAADLH